MTQRALAAMNKERTMTKSSSGDARAHARRARRRGAGLGSEEEEARAGEIRAWCGWGLRGRGGGARGDTSFRISFSAL